MLQPAARYRQQFTGGERGDQTGKQHDRDARGKIQ